ncbi:MAG: SAM-dependent methyltransferase [Verrucomicrobia bacterium]|nr:SAM-dependent methyltransferase [Verrucomicrobiota bacterium]
MKPQPPHDPTAAAPDRFLEMLRGATADGTLVKLTLGHYQGAEPGLKKVLARPVRIRGELRLSCVFRYATRDVTKNFLPGEGIHRVRGWLAGDFQSAYLATTRAAAELTCPAGAAPRLVVTPAPHAAPSDLRHDRVKARRIDPEADRWLEALGVTTRAGTVRHGMEGKFRQIDKYLEILEALLARLPGARRRDLRLVDMGCGKGYLTFAACRHLQRTGWRLTARGVEARADLVEQANRIAREHAFDGLRFECGRIADTAVAEGEVLVALHACDTATDDALAKGVQAGAPLILSAPCCHRELRPQLRPPPALADACAHGILRGRLAEWATDALRAALLEWAGYDTSVFEFISSEHTAKNLMIAAVQRPSPARDGDRARGVLELAASFGVRHQRLAQQLGFRLG